jgi:hypothetical protein
MRLNYFNTPGDVKSRKVESRQGWCTDHTLAPLFRLAHSAFRLRRSDFDIVNAPTNSRQPRPPSRQYCQYNICTPQEDAFRVTYSHRLQQRHRQPHPQPPSMSHESVWYSRPRTYGKGSREWYVIAHTRDIERKREKGTTCDLWRKG